jgi:hypothetical protein
MWPSICFFSAVWRQGWWSYSDWSPIPARIYSCLLRTQVNMIGEWDFNLNDICLFKVQYGGFLKAGTRKFNNVIFGLSMKQAIQRAWVPPWLWQRCFSGDDSRDCPGFMAGTKMVFPSEMLVCSIDPIQFGKATYTINPTGMLVINQLS